MDEVQMDLFGAGRLTGGNDAAVEGVRLPWSEGMRLSVGEIRIRYVRHLRAYRYRIILRSTVEARCTVPRFGTLKEARRFVESTARWLEDRIRARLDRPVVDRRWCLGREVWFRGERMRLEWDEGGNGVRLGDLVIRVDGKPADDVDLRGAVERAMRGAAVRELSVRLKELGGAFQFQFRRVSIRNQRSRWGSCSARGTISLNWRLIQTPGWVSDYILLHELAHLRHANHSSRYWAEVERICPGYEKAEAWLKREGRQLLSE